MSSPKQNKFRLIGSVLVLFIPLFVYVYTLCRVVYWEDSAELSAALGTLGLPHSPSFPLYVLCGYLFSQIPLGSIAFRSNLFSAVVASMSLFCLYHLILSFLSRTKSEHEGSSSPVAEAVALSSTLILGFTSAFWINAVRAEVYTLNSLLLMLVLLLLVRWVEAKNDKLLVLFFFMYGLSFGNHSLLMFLCGPAFVYFIMINRSRGLFATRKVAIYITLFMLGMSVYAFLPLRSIQDPLMDWGNPQTLSNFIEAFSRKTSVSYSSFQFAGVPYVFASLVHQFTPFVFWLGVLGVWVFFFKDRKWTLFSLVLLLVNMVYVGLGAAYRMENYDGQGYLTVSYVVYSLWIAIALNWIGSKMRKFRNIFVSSALMMVLLLLPLFPLQRHSSECDKRKVSQAHEYGIDVISSVKEDAVILVNNASPLFILWYLKYVEGHGEKIKVVDRKTLKMESYRLHLVKQYPEMNFPRVRFDIPKLGKADRLDSLKARTSLFVKEFIGMNIGRFPIYWESGRDDSLVYGHLVPNGLLFRVVPERVESLTGEMVKTHYQLMKGLAAKTENLPECWGDLKTKEYYSVTLTTIGNWFYTNDLLNDALYHYNLSIRIDPQNGLALNNFGACLAKKGQLEKAIAFFKRAIHSDPENIDALVNLGMCFYKLGQPDEADYCWERVLQLDKNNGTVLNILKETKER